MTTATPSLPVRYRAQFRPKRSAIWSTYSERDSQGAAWDELLVAAVPAGSDLRVIAVRPMPRTVEGDR
jgi:hypothetical protein